MARVKTDVYLIAFLVSHFYPLLCGISNKQGFLSYYFITSQFDFYSIKYVSKS